MLQHARLNAPSSLATQVPVARSQNALQHLRFDGLNVRYVGPGADDTQAATARTNLPVPPDCTLYYFEVQVISKGEWGFIGIGFCADDVLLSRLPGWEPHSYGYHGDDGYAFSGCGRGAEYGPTYTTGDTIGALLSRVDNTIRYFKNGADLGVAFRNVQEEKLYPCVGLRTQGEEVLLNLGRSVDAPFVADLNAVVQAVKQAVQQSVESVVLPSAAKDGTPFFLRLLHDHLLHQRCWQSASMLAKSVLPWKTVAAATAVDPSAIMLLASLGGAAAQLPSLAPVPHHQDANGHKTTTLDRSMAAGPSCASEQELHIHVNVRQKTFELVCSGRMDAARAALEHSFGSRVLSSRSCLDFRLKVAQFCELVSSNDIGAAMAYGREVLAQHTPKLPEDEELLCDALSLLAYEAPAASPCGYLLSQGHRTKLAEDLDSAILEAAGLHATSTLERLVTQCVACMDELKDLNHPKALLLDPVSRTLAG